MYVQTEVYRADTARPYYSVSQFKFELAEGENGYVIRKVIESNVKEMTAPDLEKLQLNSGEKQEPLFTVQDVPKQNIKNNNIRLGSLVWNQKTDQVIFSVQEMRDETKSAKDQTNLSAVTLWIYDRKNKSFTFLDRIESLNNEKNIVIQGISISPDGKYLAADVFSEDHLSVKYVLIYDLKEKKQLARLDQAQSFLWQGNRFIIQRNNNNQSMLYYFDPKTKKITY